ncbi:MAG TPA: glycosyltransferase [Acidobacteria bacterium]|nr:glycosyltransferase [Acidobacteriota bacterium]
MPTDSGKRHNRGSCFWGRCLMNRSAGPIRVLLPGTEDFGIAPVEGQACGRPVVALRQGGACETVIDGVTGVLVPEATDAAFADAVHQVVHGSFDPDTIRRHALKFSRERFQDELREQLGELMAPPTESVAS